MAEPALPDHYSLSQLYANIVERSGDGVSQTLDVLEQCLLYSGSTFREPGDSQYVQKLFKWVAVAIKPAGNILIQDNPKHIEDLISTSSTAFKCMRHLQARFLSQEPVDPDALLSIIAYTDVEDSWTPEATQREAERVLDYHKEQLKTHDFLVEHVLVGFIRPLFSNSRTTSVTSQGRKALSQTVQKPYNLRGQDESKKPWKFKEVSAMTVLRWAISNMDESIFQKNWHLCIPPLLTLLDDPSTIVRVRGLHISRDLLRRMPSKMLQQTGLGEVFEDAVMPTLLFLPELTPLEESISLLKSAYLALSTLADVRYPTKDERGKKMKFLDRVMRHGVLQGFMHSGDNVRITELLVEEVIILFDRMGIHAVKYLKDIIPMLSKILTDPFGLSHPSLLLTAAKATQATLVNCWPRMMESNHRVELVRALTLCWAAVKEEIGTNNEPKRLELEAIKQELQLAGNTLVRAVSEKIDVKEELQPLIHVDPSLVLLFGMDTTLSQ